MPNIPPIPGPATESAIPQAGQGAPAKVAQRQVLPREAHEPATGFQDSDGRSGGSIYTKGWEQSETRPQELHSSVRYQEATADPAARPKFNAYTELTRAAGDVK